MISHTEMMRRVKTALAEMGYPNEHVTHQGDFCEDGTPIVGRFGVRGESAPSAVWWKARKLSDPRFPCWSCWSDTRHTGEGAASLCRSGDCQHPEGPSEPPRGFFMRAAAPVN